jgi:hypothetical protein
MPTPIPLPDTIRLRILKAMKAAIEVASATTAEGVTYAKPAGLAVHRYRFRSIEEPLAAVVMFAPEEAIGGPAERIEHLTGTSLDDAMLIQVEVRAEGDVLEDATDKVLSWADIALEAATCDPAGLGGLVKDLIPVDRGWKGKPGSSTNHAGACTTYMVKYTTLRSDPTRAGV